LKNTVCNLYILLTVHLDISCNENQADALFILNLFRQSRACLLPIIRRCSLYTVYVQRLVRVMRLS
jgi:hypothetical protein